MQLEHHLRLPTGEQDPGDYARELRHHLNTLLSLALGGQALDLAPAETEALRGVSDLMLALHLAESLGREDE